jgi:hypothetical protein
MILNELCNSIIKKFSHRHFIAVDTFLPQKMIKKHPTDRPWITNKIKLGISRRQSVLQQQGKKF